MNKTKSIPDLNLKFLVTISIIFLNLLAGVCTAGSNVTIEHGHVKVDGVPYFVRGVNYNNRSIGKFPGYGPGWSAYCEYIGDLSQFTEDDDGLFVIPAHDPNNPQFTCDEPISLEFENAAELDRDFSLISTMGANTLRTWGEHTQLAFDKASQYGLYLMPVYWILQNLDYVAEKQAALNAIAQGLQSQTVQGFLNFVQTYKDRDSLLMWNLSNENALFTCTYPGAQAGVNCDIDAQVSAFFDLVNIMAGEAKALEGPSAHPVIIVNAWITHLAGNATRLGNIDAIGINAYTGPSFGVDQQGSTCSDQNISLWKRYECIPEFAGKPLFITEFGTDTILTTCDVPDSAPNSNECLAFSYQYSETTQASQVVSAWQDIVAHSVHAGGQSGGGFVFYWSDDWSKVYESNSHWTPSVATHDKRHASHPKLIPDWNAGQPDGYINLEWMGIVARAKGPAISSDIVTPRQVYFDLQPALDLDTDNDTLNDQWEISQFGDISRDGTGDFDSDGLTDLEEFHAITLAYDSDTDGDGIQDGDDPAPLTPCSDEDGDDVCDIVDNCTNVANPAQIDTDADGHGNACDGDFTDDCNTNIFDLFDFKANFAGTDQEFDLDSTGGPVAVNIFDLFAFKGLFGSAPGPSHTGSLCNP